MSLILNYWHNRQQNTRIHTWYVPLDSWDWQTVLSLLLLVCGDYNTALDISHSNHDSEINHSSRTIFRIKQAHLPWPHSLQHQHMLGLHQIWLFQIRPEPKPDLAETCFLVTEQYASDKTNGVNNAVSRNRGSTLQCFLCCVTVCQLLIKFVE